MIEIRMNGDLDGLHKSNSNIPFEIEFSNPEHHGLSAKFRIRHLVGVRDRDPENVDDVVFEQQFMVASHKSRIDVPSSKFPTYGFNGSKIGIACQAEVVVDDAIFFDTKHRIDVPLLHLRRNNDGLAAHPADELAPPDSVNFARNFLAISMKQRIAWIAAFASLIFTAVGNFLLALFDTFVASQPIFYSGQNEVALFGSGAGAVAGGVGFAFVHKRILRSYKTAKLVDRLPTILKGTRYRLADFFLAKSTVNLGSVTLRFIVANLECGQYWRGSGTDRSRVSFTHPSRALVLYEKTVTDIPKEISIEAYFSERLDLDKAFECILPDNMISSSHGIKIRTMIQIMVDDLADTSLELPSDIWNQNDFIDNRRSKDNS